LTPLPGPIVLGEADPPWVRRLRLSVGARLRILFLMNFTKNIGMLLLAIFLILYGITTTGVVAISTVVLGVVALLAGIFIIIGK
jgi:hypothetical protein